ncbi:MAG: hypothetical protein A3I68_08665 [Candidatus Melainabacteria bacterium RIFCSPLOWO2_02_FULL_35_15]|nr:MAG: hypothetical protein A3I68_08665 [Candidatus Melainabacteria bacterium RIFCSPLOWO2_02_FULL_35_15]
MNATAPALQAGNGSVVPASFIPTGLISLDNSHSGRRDEFIASPEVQGEAGESPSFFTRFVQGVVNTTRNVWRAIRQYNPITLLFNHIEQRSIAGFLETARTRNGATTNEELTNYHRSIEYNSDSSDNSNALYRFHRSSSHRGNSPGHLVIISNGHLHDLNSPESSAGIRSQVQRFLDAGCDVLEVRAGIVSHELLSRVGIGSPLHPVVVETHVGNIIEDVWRGVGAFSGRGYNYQDVSALCYSYGAGNMQNNINSRLQHMPFAATVYLDGIDHLAHGLACPVNLRPNHSGIHCSIFQGNSYFTNGAHPANLRPGDRSILVQGNNIDHHSIDNDSQALNTAFGFIMGAININTSSS